MPKTCIDQQFLKMSTGVVYSLKLFHLHTFADFIAPVISALVVECWPLFSTMIVHKTHQLKFSVIILCIATVEACPGSKKKSSNEIKRNSIETPQLWNLHISRKRSLDPPNQNRYQKRSIEKKEESFTELAKLTCFDDQAPHESPKKSCSIALHSALAFRALRLVVSFAAVITR